jgi:ferredoxin-thioredoxin reductase catalytic subunit
MSLSGIQIFKLLPKTNCKECSLPTCLAFAMALAASKAELSACPFISEEAKAKFKESSLSTDLTASETVPALNDDTRSVIKEAVIRMDEGTEESEERKAEILICSMADFVINNHCLLGPLVDIDGHIASLIGNRSCLLMSEERVEKQQTVSCPCHEADAELHKDGYTSCGVFVTEKYLRLKHRIEQINGCKKKTKVLLSVTRKDLKETLEWQKDH